MSIQDDIFDVSDRVKDTTEEASLKRILQWAYEMEEDIAVFAKENTTLKNAITLIEKQTPKSINSQLKQDTIEALKTAEKTAHCYATSCDVGPERDFAFQVYEKIRIATRKIN